MPTNVDRTGTFRCKLLEKGITKTKEKGYPQLVARVALTQFYDAKEEDWFDITDWDMETNAYACLYGVSKKSQQVEPTLSYDQVMKVFDWDGGSLAELDQADHEGLEFQIRVTENTYEGAKFPFQVSWLDVYGADPVYTLRKLDAKEVKDLDAQFSNITASAKKAASAKPKTVKPHPARVPADDKPLSKTEKQAIAKKKSDRIKQESAKKKKAKAAAPPLPADEGELSLPEAKESITKKQAWDGIHEMKDPTIRDGTIEELWNIAIQEVTGQEVVKHKDVTGEQWYQVKEIVLKDCGKF
jgi:hypothetical protein